jgi:hypothetical protein
MEADVCWACRTGLHAECFDVQEHSTVEGESALIWYACCCAIDPEPEPDTTERRGVGRPMLNPDDVTDVKSTGRKRAAMLAPIFDGMLCEWACLKYAGGGVQPIVGCYDTTIKEAKGSGERHHGPDKNVLNNSVGVNLHRICQSCHKRWHAMNDRYYPADRPEAGTQFVPVDYTSYPHDSLTLASDEDLESSDEYWMTRTENRGEYPIALPA